MKKQPKNMREARLKHQLTNTKPSRAISRSQKVQNNEKPGVMSRARYTLLGLMIGGAVSLSLPTVASSLNTSGSSAHQTVANTATTSGSQPGTGSINVLTTGGTSASDNSNASLENMKQLMKIEGIVASTTAADAQSCAQSEDGLMKTAADAVQMRTTVLSKVIDVNKIFQPAKQGGCFAELGQIPDLSVIIPSYSNIGNILLEKLKDYANKKVCDAVYEASSQIVGPINEALNEINKYSNAYDFSKEFASVGDKWGLDPEIFVPSSKTEISYGVGGFNVTEIPGGSSGTGGSSSGSGSSGSSNTGGIGGSIDTGISSPDVVTTQKSSAARNASSIFQN
ncbi:TPA: hypothetical protein ACGIK9_002927 [Acinetobacter baumannii]|uniref:hypothetical protein n=1 Tax=Acinetobacter baumannii TaxID=470 RepID=UPI00338FC4E9